MRLAADGRNGTVSGAVVSSAARCSFRATATVTATASSLLTVVAQGCSEQRAAQCIAVAAWLAGRWERKGKRARVGRPNSQRDGTGGCDRVGPATARRRCRVQQPTNRDSASTIALSLAVHRWVDESDVGRQGSGERSTERAERFRPADFADPAASPPQCRWPRTAALARPVCCKRMGVKCECECDTAVWHSAGAAMRTHRAADRTEIGRHSTAALHPPHQITAICTHSLHSSALQHITTFSVCSAYALCIYPPPAHTLAPPLIDSPRSRPPPRPAVGIMVDIDSDAEYARRLQDEVRRETRLRLQRGALLDGRRGRGHSECQRSPDWLGLSHHSSKRGFRACLSALCHPVRSYAECRSFRPLVSAARGTLPLSIRLQEDQAG